MISSQPPLFTTLFSSHKPRVIGRKTQRRPPRIVPLRPRRGGVAKPHRGAGGGPSEGSPRCGAAANFVRWGEAAQPRALLSPPHAGRGGTGARRAPRGGAAPPGGGGGCGAEPGRGAALRTPRSGPAREPCRCRAGAGRWLCSRCSSASSSSPTSRRSRRRTGKLTEGRGAGGGGAVREGGCARTVSLSPALTVSRS